MPIQKGEPGTFAKIEEEFAELKDAINQQCVPLELWEIADLLLAIKQYLLKRYNISFDSMVNHAIKIESMHQQAQGYARFSPE